MKKITFIVIIISMYCNVSHGALFYGKETLPIVSNPEGAHCTLKNKKGSWKVKTPDKIDIKLVKEDLQIVCKKSGYHDTILNSSLKNRNKVSPKYYPDVKVFNDNWDIADTAINGLIAVVSQHPIDIGIFLIESVPKLAEKTINVVKNTSKKSWDFLKRNFKDKYTYANAIISTDLYYNKIISDKSKRIKDEGNFGFIFIELKKDEN